MKILKFSWKFVKWYKVEKPVVLEFTIRICHTRLHFYIVLLTNTLNTNWGKIKNQAKTLESVLNNSSFYIFRVKKKSKQKFLNLSWKIVNFSYRVENLNKNKKSKQKLLNLSWKIVNFCCRVKNLNKNKRSKQKLLNLSWIIVHSIFRVKNLK